MKTLSALLLLALAAPARARTVDSHDDAAFVRDGKLFRFDYANDFFAATDRYYTQGYGFTLFHPRLSASPLFSVLPSLGGESAFGLVFRDSGFTPTSYLYDRPLIGDRPFASYLLLGHRRISRDDARGLTLSCALDLGIIGQAAGGKWIQVGLHRALGNQQPHGWDNQIRNDLVLDYSAQLEKRLASTGWADVGVYADAMLGTLYTNAAAGFSGRLGALSQSKPVFLFARVEERVVGYDATLQGGVFNRGSPYTLRAAQLERAVPRADIGAVLDRGGWALAFSRSFIGRELKEGLSQSWGELSFIKRF